MTLFGHALNVIPIHIPPLRQRREDIPPLVEHFLEELTGQSHQLAAGVMEYILAQPWWGNVRELRNVVERAVAISDGDQIQLDDMHWSVETCAEIEAQESMSSIDPLLQRLSPQAGGKNLLELVEKVLIQAALEQAQGNQSKAAELLGLDRKQIARRLKKYSPPKESPGDQ